MDCRKVHGFFFNLNYAAKDLKRPQKFEKKTHWFDITTSFQICGLLTISELYIITSSMICHMWFANKIQLVHLPISLSALQ